MQGKEDEILSFSSNLNALFNFYEWFYVFFRSYISFDILRRVLSDYFGYEIHYVMNITDIDDKIIKRARQNFLYEKYIEENVDLTKVLEDADSILKMLSETVHTTTDEDKKAMIDRMLAKVTAGVEELEAAVKAGSVEGIRTAQKVSNIVFL